MAAAADSCRIARASFVFDQEAPVALDSDGLRGTAARGRGIGPTDDDSPAVPKQADRPGCVLQNRPAAAGQGVPLGGVEGVNAQGEVEEQLQPQSQFTLGSVPWAMAAVFAFW